jgi:hypothetical protein
MPFDKFVDLPELLKERLQGIQQSLRSISLEELNEITKQHQDEFVGDPWRDEFLSLMAEHPHASFYHAAPKKNIEIFYCHDRDFGFWVVPGTGSGPLSEQNKRQIKEAIELSRSGAKTGPKK